MPEPTPTPRLHGRHEPTDHEELIMFLERDQLVADTSLPVSPAHLSTRLKAALWALRTFVILVSFMVLYTFVHQLN
ncbi:MAG: hypothetical protein ACYC91_15840 [Solirubrobacteraceae bacterium]